MNTMSCLRMPAGMPLLLPCCLALAVAPLHAQVNYAEAETSRAERVLAADDSRLPESRAAAPTPAELSEVAVRALAPLVRRQSHPEALTYATRAYYAYRAAHPQKTLKPYLYFVDYGLPNSTPRGYVFDMDALTLIEGPFTVAHGRGSSRRRNGAPTRFSNRAGSAMTSLGLYVAQETYAFSGTSGGRRYTSIGLRMEGVSGRFNSAARRRGIVTHGAPYVTSRDAGRSEGCPAMEQQRARRLIPLLANGALVFLFSARDSDWLANAPWARTTTAVAAAAS